MNKTSLINYLFYVFSIFMALGTFDPIFKNSPVQTIDIMFVLLMSLIVLFYPKEVIKNLISIDCLLLVGIFFLFIFAQVFHGYGELLKPLANIKFFMCISFFLVVKLYLQKNQFVIHNSLLIYSTSAFLYSIYVLFVNPDIYTTHKGQMIILEENPNSTSSRFVIATAYLIYFVIKNPLGWKRGRLGFLTFIPSMFFLVIASGSRGSLLALMLGGYIILIMSDVSKTIKVFLTGISVVVSLMIINYLFSSEHLSNRWENALEGDTAGRVDIWKAVINIVKENPIGVGETGYLEKILNIYGKYIDTHNLFLYVLVCGGVLSFFLYLAFLMKIFHNSFKIYLINKDVLPLLIFIVMMFISSKTGGAITYLLFWYLLAIVASYRIGKVE